MRRGDRRVRVRRRRAGGSGTRTRVDRGHSEGGAHGVGEVGVVVMVAPQYVIELLLLSLDGGFTAVGGEGNDIAANIPGNPGDSGNVEYWGTTREG